MAAARLLLSLAFAGATLLPIETTPSPLVLAFASGLALVTGLLFGAAPAWFATRTDPIEALRGSGRTAGDRASFARTALLVVQATLSRGAGGRLDDARPQPRQPRGSGLRLQPRRARAGHGRPAVGRRSPASGSPRSTATCRAGWRAFPGCRAPGWRSTTRSPTTGAKGILIAGKPAPAPGAQTGASWDRVTHDYLQLLGTKLVKGRHFTEADNETAEAVAIVNEAFVKRFFKPEEDPLDQHFGLNLPENVNHFRIVGVIADARFQSFQTDRPVRPMFYVPLPQRVDLREPDDGAGADRVDVRRRAAAGHQRHAPGVLEPQVARALAEADPNLAVINIRTLEQQVRADLQSAARRGQPGRVCSASSRWSWPPSASTA